MISSLREIKYKKKCSQFYKLFDKFFVDMSDDEQSMNWLVVKQLGVKRLLNLRVHLKIGSIDIFLYLEAQEAPCRDSKECI